MTTQDALDRIRAERERQKATPPEGAGTDGLVTSRNDLLLVALRYATMAADGVRRNADYDPTEMMTKAAAVLVDAMERGA